MKKGTIVKDCRGRYFEITKITDVFGIPNAELVRVKKKDYSLALDSHAVRRGHVKTHNLPVSWLTVVRD